MLPATMVELTVLCDWQKPQYAGHRASR